jgi:DNA-directed RNA polymerase specialized sigma24 family protein
MERATAVAMLPPAHAHALELAARGVPDSEIAAELNVDLVSVGPLLAVARAKLEALEALPQPNLGE